MTTRRPYDDVIAVELQKIVRQEMLSGLSSMFEGMQRAVLRDNTASASINVVINNNAGADVSARETMGAFGQKQLEITIDQMVANSLAQGRQTTGVLRTLFGLAPDLIGR